MIDIEKLKQAALAATQGEWAFGSFHELLVVPVKDGAPDKYDPIANLGETAIPWDMDTYSAERYKNAEHIATASPSAVLELITRLEAAESQLVSQELHIKQLREALEALNNYARERCCGLLIVDQALAIPVSTEHLEAWYREQAGEPTGYYYRDDPEKFAMPGSGYSHDYPTDALDVVPLHAIKPFPFKGE